jgi:glutathione S-transferase
MPITLYGAPNTRSLRVAWTLEELGLDWDCHYIDFSKAAHRAPQFLAINPVGKVPALKDGDLVLIESSAICLYLAERYGDGCLLPEPGSKQRALHQQWVSFIISELEQPLWSLGKHKFALPAQWRVAQMLEIAPKEFDQALAVAESWIPEEGMLLGADLTVADILLAHTLIWARAFGQTLTPRASAYCDRLAARPQLGAARERELAARVEV